jgi:TetR/AcrR family transcriptional regulator, cholesterol catabolism regulator
MTREAILTAAAQIFTEKGFHAASMQDIADAVQLQKASLYHHVSSKQEILLAILDQTLDLLIDQLTEILSLDLPPQQKLRLGMISYLRILTEHHSLASVLLLEHRSLQPDLKARHIPRRNRFEDLWRSLIQEGQSVGVFACTDIGFTTRTLLGAMNWTITWYRPDGILSGEEIANRYADLFFGGLLSSNGVGHGFAGDTGI